VKKKILIDECLPLRLAIWLGEHDAETVAHRGWAGKDDGDILRLAEAAGFDVLLTADANIKDQRKLEGMNLSVVAIPTNRQHVVESILPQIRQSVGLAQPGTFALLSFATPDFGQ
jgi:predicted nuclease of predicted toxin-antitoxin system